VSNCDHQTVMNADYLPDGTMIRPLGDRMACSRCGYIGAISGPIGRSAGISRAHL
jgi:hypothetical protein